MRCLILSLFLIAPLSLAQAQSVEEGQTLFNDKCMSCHNPAATGSVMLGKRLGEENAVLSERNNLSAEYIKVVLRYGVGSMPWYRRSEISDAQADAIAAYLTRNNP